MAANVRGLSCSKACHWSRFVIATVASPSPKASDLSGRRAVAGLCNERACRHDPAQRDLAVETDPHETAGPQQRRQHAPARIRIVAARALVAQAGYGSTPEEI